MKRIYLEDEDVPYLIGLLDMRLKMLGLVQKREKTQKAGEEAEKAKTVLRELEEAALKSCPLTTTTIICYCVQHNNLMQGGKYSSDIAFLGIS